MTSSMRPYSSLDGDPQEGLSSLSRWIFTNVIGCLAGLMWCYIVVLQFDPELKCPTTGCWRVVSALWAWVVFGVVALPWLSLVAMRTLRRRPTREEEFSDLLLTTTTTLTTTTPNDRRYYVSPLEISGRRRRPSSSRWEDETLSRARELVARAMGTAWSVGLYSALTATIRQVEYDALQNVGLLARCGDQGVGCALRGVLVLTFFSGSIATVVTAFAILVVGLSTRILARGKLVSPLVVETFLMLRGNFYYSVASAWTMTLGLLWFAPYELGPAADNAFLSASASSSSEQRTGGLPGVNVWNESSLVRFAFAAARSLTLVLLFSHLALHVLPDPPNDDDVESVADAPLLHCAVLLAFKASAVVVALATNDAAQGILAEYERQTGGNKRQLTVSGFAYGGLLLVLGALYFLTSYRKKKKKRQAWTWDHHLEKQHLVDKTRTPTTTDQEQEEEEEEEVNANANAKGDLLASTDERRKKTLRFAFLVYTWLVILATWSPWKRLLIAVYAALGRAGGRFFLLPFQVALACAFSLLFALLQVAVDKLLHLCCGAAPEHSDHADSLRSGATPRGSSLGDNRLPYRYHYGDNPRDDYAADENPFLAENHPNTEIF